MMEWMVMGMNEFAGKEQNRIGHLVNSVWTLKFQREEMKEAEMTWRKGSETKTVVWMLLLVSEIVILEVGWMN